ncbi:MAG: hypothetical protein KAW41_02640 [Candidatus Diapherotrites archaeon]|nr:hypothetical protein [Candidatus Diapherotrites archaeon]
MRRALLALLLFVAVASAANFSASLDRTNGTYYTQDKEYSVKVTVKNTHTANNSYYVLLLSDGTRVLINKTDGVRYEIEDLEPGDTHSKTWKMKVTNAMPFRYTEYLELLVSDDLNDTRNGTIVEVKTPEFSSIEAKLTYEPSNAATGKLKVTAETSEGDSTKRFNVTYYLKNKTGVCMNKTTDKKEFTVDFENCSSGIYDFVVEGHADNYTKTDKTRDFFLFRNLTITAHFYQLEEFGFERNIEQIGFVKGNESLRVRGRAVYDEGTVLGYGPDDERTNYLNMTIYSNKKGSKYDKTYTIHPSANGNYSLYFEAPQNTSKYEVTIKAFSKYNEDKDKYDYKPEIEYNLIVNNTVDYATAPLNNTGVMANLGIKLGNQSRVFNGGGLVLAVQVTNNNSVSVTGRPVLVEKSGASQFVVATPASDTVLGGHGRAYSLTVTPKKYTRPGEYDVDVKFSTIYGALLTPVTLTVPAEDLIEGEVNVFRYVEYTSDSTVSLKLVNQHTAKATAKVREDISKDVVSRIVDIQHLLGSCAMSDTECRLGHILESGTCSDCASVDWNASKCFVACEGKGNLTQACRANCTSLAGNCTANCTNRTVLKFSPIYNTLIDADPIVEWNVVVPAGGEAEVSYYTGMLVDEDWFTEPVVEALFGATPTPTATPVPTVAPEPTLNATATPRPKPKPPSGIPQWMLIVMGTVFFLFVAAGIGVAYVFTQKRELVDEFIEKYAPEHEPTEAELERMNVRKLFVTEEPPKPKPAPEPEVPEEPKESIISRLDKMFSPKEKGKGPEKYKPKPAAPPKPEAKPEKEEKKKEKKKPDFKELKEIGKGFADNL